MRSNINSVLVKATIIRKEIYDVTAIVRSLSFVELSQDRSPLKFNEITVLATRSVIF